MDLHEVRVTDYNAGEKISLMRFGLDAPDQLKVDYRESIEHGLKP